MTNSYHPEDTDDNNNRSLRTLIRAITLASGRRFSLITDGVTDVVTDGVTDVTDGVTDVTDGVTDELVVFEINVVTDIADSLSPSPKTSNPSLTSVNQSVAQSTTKTSNPSAAKCPLQL